MFDGLLIMFKVNCIAYHILLLVVELCLVYF